MCMRASGASEFRKLLAFSDHSIKHAISFNILSLHSLANHLYTMVEFYLECGASAPQAPPPPPHQYASADYL